MSKILSPRPVASNTTNEYAPRLEGADSSDNRTVTVTIYNHTSGSLTYKQSSTTGGDLDIKNNTISSGSSATAFVGSGPNLWYSGCGGEVTYNLPNGMDILTVVYNCTTTGNNCTTFAQLQNANGQNPGCGSYFAVVNPGSVTETQMSTTVDIYEAGDSASGQTGSVYPAYVRISIQNNLSTWITLNNFPDPSYTGLNPMVCDGTTSIAPGTQAVVLSTGSAYDFQQIFNLSNEVLLTVTQQQADSPTAGLSTAGPYSTSVSGGYQSDGDYYAYTVTVTAA